MSHCLKNVLAWDQLCIVYIEMVELSYKLYFSTVYEYSFDQIVNYENGTKFKNGDQNKHRSSSLKCKDLFGCQIIEILGFFFHYVFYIFYYLSHYPLTVLQLCLTSILFIK